MPLAARSCVELCGIAGCGWCSGVTEGVSRGWGAMTSRGRGTTRNNQQPAAVMPSYCRRGPVAEKFLSRHLERCQNTKHPSQLCAAQQVWNGCWRPLRTGIDIQHHSFSSCIFHLVHAAFICSNSCLGNDDRYPSPPLFLFISSPHSASRSLLNRT